MMPKKYILLTKGSPFDENGESAFGYFTTRNFAETMCERLNREGAEQYYFSETDGSLEMDSVVSCIACLDYLIDYMKRGLF